MCLKGDKNKATLRWFQGAKTHSLTGRAAANPGEVFFLFGLQSSALQFTQAKKQNVNAAASKNRVNMFFSTSAISWLCLFHWPLITHIVIHVKKLWTLKCSHESDPACPHSLSYRFLTTWLYCISRCRKNSQGLAAPKKKTKKLLGTSCRQSWTSAARRSVIANTSTVLIQEEIGVKGWDLVRDAFKRAPSPERYTRYGSCSVGFRSFHQPHCVRWRGSVMCLMLFFFFVLSSVCYVQVLLWNWSAWICHCTDWFIERAALALSLCRLPTAPLRAKFSLKILLANLPLARIVFALWVKCM